MKTARFVLGCFLIMGGAATAAWCAVASIQISGILPSIWSAADVIRTHCPVHLVSSEWIRGGDQASILFSWATAELRARLLLVGALWLFAVGALFHRAFQRRQA